MSLPRELRARMREAMQLLPTWRRQETRDTVITARRNGLTIRECAAAAGCSPRHAKRILAAAGMAGMGRADALHKGATAPTPAPVSAPPAPERVWPDPPLPTVEESNLARAQAAYEREQERRREEAAAREQEPEPAPDGPPRQIVRDGVMVRFNPDMDYSEVMALHPLDRALLGFSFGDFTQTHPHDAPKRIGGFSHMFGHSPKIW